MPAGTERKTTKMNGEVHMVHTKHTRNASSRVGVVGVANRARVPEGQMYRKEDRKQPTPGKGVWLLLFVCFGVVYCLEGSTGGCQ